MSNGLPVGEMWTSSSMTTVSRRVDVYGEEECAEEHRRRVRTVPLSDQLVAMLKTWKIKSQFSKADDLIFPNRNGRHVGHDNLIKRQFLPLFDELTAVKRFNWHGLRHFAVSCWIDAGLAPKTVQTFAGHASLQVTMDRYGHLFPSADHGRRWIYRQGTVLAIARTLAELTSLLMCHPCDMDTPVQDHTRRERLDFVGI